MTNYRLYYKKLTNWHDPEKVFLNLYSEKKYTFWLGHKSHSYMGIASKRIKYTLPNHTLSISNNKTKKFRQNILTYLQQMITNSHFSTPSSDPIEVRPRPIGVSPDSIGVNPQISFPFTGGFIGYLGYEMKAICDSPPTLAHNLSFPNSRFPDAYFFFVDRFLAFDHKKKHLYLVTLSQNKKDADQWFSATKNQMLTSNLTIQQINNKTIKPALTFSRSRQQYIKDIKTCQKYLTQGDAYQVCLTNQITVKTNLRHSRLTHVWLALYRTLRKINPAPYSAYINFGNFALISSSPEQFLNVDKNGWATSKPMKGTVRRGSRKSEDIRLAQNLGKSEKDFAENIMIADLTRNDFGKVCRLGSIKVEKPLSVETYPTVHQLVSTIKGKLLPGKTIIDLLKACFPGGSMTGAPKTRAMEIITELEKEPRGIYSGAFGFLSLNGTANLAMTIRTIIATKNEFSFGAGGAVLTDSVPETEYEEMLLKTKALLSAISKSTPSP